LAREKGKMEYPLKRKASIKDIIECLGIPHTEVGSIVSNDQNWDLSASFLPHPVFYRLMYLRGG
jgi:uncharacterized protein